MRPVSSSWQRALVTARDALILGALLGTQPSSAQTMQDRMDGLTAQMQHVQEFSAKMPPFVRDKLSIGAQNLLYRAEHWDRLARQLSRRPATATVFANTTSFALPQPLPPGEVSDPSDDTVGRLGGFVQNTTSTAWCGNTVVVAYNDSGSILETLPDLTIGISGNGYSRSVDGGQTFTDEGYLNSPLFYASLDGDPVVACSDENTFYQSSLYGSWFGNFDSFGVSISKSTDGGQTFGDPIPVVLKSPADHFIDKPWMAIDPSNPKTLYITYTDVDVTGGFDTNAICPDSDRVTIELVTSRDAGATWSSPSVIDSVCNFNFDQGSNVAVDRQGNVFVAWEYTDVIQSTKEIDIAKSTNGGASFSPKTVAVAGVIPLGSGWVQATFLNNEYPSLAIDRSRGPRRGSLYLAWNDGRNGAAPTDLLGNTYQFGDILVIRSDDGGASWTAPIKMNDDIGAANGIDHFQPGIAVSLSGTVGACWYDRRRDPNNFLIDRECATSLDGGKTWLNTRITRTNFSPITTEDNLLFPGLIGDYDGVTSDFLGTKDGFLGAYADTSKGNQDVRISRRFGAPDDSGSLDDN